MRGDEKYSFGHKNFCLWDLALSSRREDESYDELNTFIPCHKLHELVKTGGPEGGRQKSGGGHGPLLESPLSMTLLDTFLQSNRLSLEFVT